MTADAPPRQTLRSVGAIFAGFIAVAVLSLGTDVVLHALGIYPPWLQRMSDPLFALATGYRMVYTVLGGYITARLAPRLPLRHAVILGVVGTVFALAGLAATWNKPELGPRWYPIALVVTALPTCWLGGKLYRGRPATP
ncbi:MAG: hypothetical protein M3P27_00410 [Acidobacteriota bacterium]|nr:hypothetical protein [Acidobacteriota bacterium]